MESSKLLLLIKYLEFSNCMSISRSTEFSFVVESIVHSFELHNKGKLSFLYSAPGHPNVFLKNSVDYDNMWCVAAALSLSCINISVHGCNQHGQTSSVPTNDRQRLSENTPTIPGKGQGGSQFPDTISQVPDAPNNKRVSETGDFYYMDMPPGYLSVHMDSYADHQDNDLADITFDIRPISSVKPLLSDGWADLIKGPGQQFSCVKAYRLSLIKCTNRTGTHFTYMRNEPARVNVVCSSKFLGGCNWFINASKSSFDDSFVIRRWNNEHSCVASTVSTTDGRVGSRLISDLVAENVRLKPLFSTNELMDLVLSDYGIKLNYAIAYRSVEKAREHVFGGHVESFQELSWYSEAIKRTNPGSIVDIEKDSSSDCFTRMFISMNASIEGFTECRPMVFLDGTFMKSIFRGTVLSAIAKDGNQGLFPLAFAVVLSENRDNWEWFLNKIKHILPLGCAVISDRNIGLMEAIPETLNGVHHFFCLEHLKRNLLERLSSRSFTERRRKYLCYLLSMSACAPSVRIFDEYVLKLKKKGGKLVCDFVDELPVEKWTVAYSPIVRYDEMTSNAAEAFNRSILTARGLPITHMIDMIRLMLMRWFAERRIEAEKWKGPLSKTMQKRWNKLLRESLSWHVKLCNHRTEVFEVFSNPSACVDLGKRTCSCLLWQTSGFACSHIAAVYRRFNKDLKYIVGKYYLKEAYAKSYSGSILPIPTSERLEIPVASTIGVINPPKMKKLAGRPRQKRIKSKGEETSRIRCSRCHKLGRHNRKSCREAVTF